ncbi:hypothetical protein Tco_0319053 [Tanacetum coccineum]
MAERDDLPVVWAEVEMHARRPELVHEITENIVQIKHRMQAARDRQKSYADVIRKPLEFQVGDQYVKVSPRKCQYRYGTRGNEPEVYWTYQGFSQSGNTLHNDATNLNS